MNQHKGLLRQQIINLERSKYHAECEKTAEILSNCFEFKKLVREEKQQKETRYQHRKEDLE